MVVMMLVHTSRNGLGVKLQTAYKSQVVTSAAVLAFVNCGGATHKHKYRLLSAQYQTNNILKMEVQ